MAAVISALGRLGMALALLVLFLLVAVVWAVACPVYALVDLANAARDRWFLP